jgi:hypothetical protein
MITIRFRGFGGVKETVLPYVWIEEVSNSYNFSKDYV